MKKILLVLTFVSLTLTFWVFSHLTASNVATYCIGFCIGRVYVKGIKIGNWYLGGLKKF